VLLSWCDGVLNWRKRTTIFAILPESFEGLRWWEVFLAFGWGYGPASGNFVAVSRSTRVEFVPT
jgi:hypothetical protein